MIHGAWSTTGAAMAESQDANGNLVDTPRAAGGRRCLPAKMGRGPGRSAAGGWARPVAGHASNAGPAYGLKPANGSVKHGVAAIVAIR